jgi:hypothetical protein
VVLSLGRLLLLLRPPKRLALTPLAWGIEVPEVEGDWWVREDMFKSLRPIVGSVGHWGEEGEGGSGPAAAGSCKVAAEIRLAEVRLAEVRDNGLTVGAMMWTSGISRMDRGRTRELLGLRARGLPETRGD